MRKVIVSLAVLALLVPLSAQAGVFLTGEDFIETTAPVGDDLFVAGNTVNVRHDVRDDVFAGGNSVTITASSGGDVFAGGNTVRIEGRVGDDILAGGNNVRITSERVGDVMVGGALIDIQSDTVDGSIYAAGQSITISGSVAGSVKAAGENIIIKSGTTIAGDLLTYGDNEPVIEDNVSIGGTQRHKLSEVRPEAGPRATIGSWVRSVLAWFVAGIVLLYLLRALVREVVTRTTERSGRSLGIGLLAALLVVPAFILLLITIVGAPLAFLVPLFASAHLIVAHALAMVAVGVWVLRRLLKETGKGTPNDITWQHVLLGVVLVKIVQLVPIVGGPALLIVTLLVWGALLEALWRRLRSGDVAASVGLPTHDNSGQHKN